MGTTGIDTNIAVNNMLQAALKPSKGTQLMNAVNNVVKAASIKPTMTYKPSGLASNVLLKGTHVNLKV